MPILVALSRVYLSYHWLSDVLASLLLGLFLAKKYRDSLDPSSLNDLS
ncbi:MAG: phosphatase PAP2 family protein [Cetobacterium sp.]